MLRALRDIEGVLGSFLVADRGRVLGRDAPAAAGTDVLEMVGVRLEQLCDVFVSAAIGGPFESTTLYFAEHRLHVRALGPVFLIAVTTSAVNLPALKLAMNLLGRQLLNELAAVSGGSGAHDAAPVPGEDRTSEVHARAVRSSEPPSRSYRGRPVSS
jgi:hypothetical protein